MPRNAEPETVLASEKEVPAHSCAAHERVALAGIEPNLKYPTAKADPCVVPVVA